MNHNEVKKIVSCPSCGTRMSAEKVPLLMTAADVKKCHDYDEITEDNTWINYIEGYGGIRPTDDEAKQVVFTPQTVGKFSFIKEKGGAYYFESQTGNYIKIRSRACPKCHSNISSVLDADEVKNVLLIGPTAASKTCCVASAVAMTEHNPLQKSDTISSGFAAGSFEENYYIRMADDLMAIPPRVQGSTAKDARKIKRQPLAYFNVRINDKKKLLVLIDHPGEAIVRGAVGGDDGAVVALMIDGDKAIAPQLGFLLQQARSNPAASAYVVVITKCDCLHEEQVNAIMLEEYERQEVFSAYADLSAARRSIVPSLLTAKMPVLRKFYDQLRRIGKPVEVICCAALGVEADEDTNILKGDYQPQFIYDMLLTFAEAE